MNQLTLTVGIIAFTCLVSFSAFSSEKIMNDLIMWPVEVKAHNQWYRFITSGFLHADSVSRISMRIGLTLLIFIRFINIQGK